MGEKVLCAMGIISIRDSYETTYSGRDRPISIVDCPLAGRRKVNHCWVCPLFIRIIRDITPEDEEKAFSLLCDVKNKVEKSWLIWRLRELKRKGVVV